MKMIRIKEKKHKLFTLIELLIVIAIIAILASMLLPALNKARAGAKKIACANTQKNIAHASFMYADDFSGYLPTCSLAGGLWRVNWVSQIAPYWGGSYDKDDWDTILKNKVISCPVTPEVILYARQDNSGYGFSQKLLYLETIKLATIRKPSGAIIFGDTWDKFEDPTHFENEYLYQDAAKIGNRHQNGINVGFADGHVSFHKTSYLQSNPELYENN